MELQDSTVFCQSDLLSTSSAILADMRERGQFCDVTIRVGERIFTAHRSVLVASIPYFRREFRNARHIGGETGITLPGVNHRALESLIRFAYSGKVNICIENACDLLETSQYLELHSVRDACAEFLSQKLNVSNAAGVHVLAHRLNIPNLIECSNSYIRKNFEDVSESSGFLTLPELCIKEILSDDRLNVSSEEAVLGALMKWVRNSPPERSVMLSELLTLVRLIYLPITSLMNLVAYEKLVRTSIPCRDLIDGVKNYHLSEDKSAFSSLITAPRRFCGLKVGIYAICRSPHECSSVYYCDCLSPTWHYLASDVHCGIIHHIVLSNETIYIFFGETIKTFHLRTLVWETLGPKHRGIIGAAVVSHGNRIYCFGGSSYYVEGLFFTHRIRCFDTQQNKWLEEGAMRMPRYKSAATSMKETIFVTGGTGLNTVEKYFPSTGHWTEVAPMLSSRWCHGCTGMNGKIFVCGGYTPTGISKTGEVYDPRVDQWNYISNMKTERISFSLVSHNSKLYAFGGLHDLSREVLNSEVYKPDSDRWGYITQVPDGIQHAVSIPGTSD